MNGFIEPLLEIYEYRKIVESVNNATSVFATGIVDVEKVHMAYAVMQHTKKPLVILTYSELRAKKIIEDMKFFHKNTISFPPKDILFYSADVHSIELNRQKFLAIEKILHNEFPVLVLSMETLLERYVKKEIFMDFIINLKVGDEVDVEDLIKKAVCLGYEHVEQVEAIGQFSLRGGILDIFSITSEQAVRIEFWDTEIDSIRTMDVVSQRSLNKIDNARIFPMGELVYTEEQAVLAGQKILADVEDTLNVMEENKLTDAMERLSFRAKEDAEILIADKTLPHVGSYISYFYDDTVTILDYLPKDTVFVFDEIERIATHMEVLDTEYQQGMEGRITQGYLLPKQGELLFSYADILQKMMYSSQVLLSNISNKTPDFLPEITLEFQIKESATFNNKIDLFFDELILLKKRGYRVIILGGNTIKCEKIVKELEDIEITSFFRAKIDEPTPEGSVVVTRGTLSQGFIIDKIKLAVFSSDEIFSVKEEKKVAKRKHKGKVLQSFTDLKIGDYVVHDLHGIGQYLGLEKITVEGIQKDYMKIVYKNEASLSVSVNQMDMVQKYIGSGANAPRLSKLGGGDWEKAKAKTRANVKKLAENLVELYAKRQITKGFAFPEDTEWQNEFEIAFPFDETDDQIHAIEDVKRDMESDKVMDRLICGDVGYGKTEVAIRAGFKAVQHGKQVVFLVPTTILAQQHYRTFVERMENYPISVELLSRFRTPKQQRESLKNMKNGFGDILIGTHRVLSKDVEFKDLGLMIIDEEQRFGVSHKEKMKRIKENVDVLTLSATPIPRTLHMSLSGIRDMSLLEEPPNERQPIQTFVMENNNEFIREAINRELARGGQIYYLYNRVEGISGEAVKIKRLVPEANVVFAHGQMPERELEKIMEEFLMGEIDVLVCTTIIETGMDISNANTIIIQDADRIGLSQLYQLRGRVGRSNRIAYAYLFYKQDKMLREVAEKRLQTIREFTEFGAGFKIALRDLEIRGAGNLLGAEQHGHMSLIGYDMYCRLLEEEVFKLQNMNGDQEVEMPKKVETNIDINVSAFISDKYINNQQQRMEIYKKIASISSEEEYFQIQEEIEDRYGDIPKKVQSLLDIGLIKSIANNIGISNIQQKDKSIIITFRENPKINLINFTELIQKQPIKYKFEQKKETKLTINLDKKANDIVNEIKILLNLIIL